MIGEGDPGPRQTERRSDTRTVDVTPWGELLARPASAVAVGLLAFRHLLERTRDPHAQGLALPSGKLLATSVQLGRDPVVDCYLVVVGHALGLPSHRALNEYC